MDIIIITVLVLLEIPMGLQVITIIIITLVGVNYQLIVVVIVNYKMVLNNNSCKHNKSLESKVCQVIVVICMERILNLFR